VLADTNFLPCHCGECHPARRGVVSASITNAINVILCVHPGPFPFISLTCGFMEVVDSDYTKLTRWFMHLGTKGVNELILINCHFPIHGPLLLSTLFSCPSPQPRALPTPAMR
jgi:hypothetical protein